MIATHASFDTENSTILKYADFKFLKIFILFTGKIAQIISISVKPQTIMQYFLLAALNWLGSYMCFFQEKILPCFYSYYHSCYCTNCTSFRSCVRLSAGNPWTLFNLAVWKKSNVKCVGSQTYLGILVWKY